MDTRRPVAAFDFDGTLAKGDSLLPFLVRLLGGRRVARSVLAHSHNFALIGIGKGDRDRTKERFIAHILSGHSEEEIRKIGTEFASELIKTRLLTEPLAKLRWHQERGHRTMLISATLDVYLEPLVFQLGIDDLICTRLEIVDGRATGKLVGYNVRAEEKARLLLLAVQRDEIELWAYGNSSGDHALLEEADHPYWVNKKGHVTPFSGA